VSDPWDEVTFDDHARAQRRRWAAWPAETRWEWLASAVEDCRRQGLLAGWRERKQREVMAAWEAGEQ
jgi:hypothetical protein